MAVSKQQPVKGKRGLRWRMLRQTWRWLRQQTDRLASIYSPPASTEYQAWQRQFLTNRLRLSLWLALLCSLTFAAVNFYKHGLHPQANLEQQAITILGDPLLYENLKRWLLLSDWLTILLLLLCLFIQKTDWGRGHPAILFLGISWSITLAPEILGTAMGFALPSSWDFIFMAQVVLVPVNWHLHLLSQLGSILYYFGVNPLFGLTEIPGGSGLFDLEIILSAVWICVICNIAVYFYDRLQQREFESRRELHLFLHAVTHDLRTPVLGVSIVLQNLLRKARGSDNQAIITTPKLEQLLAGSDRQLSLINSILEAHTSETQLLTLRCQPLQLSTLVASVLAATEALLSQSQVVLTNRVTDNLPLVHADADQLWRVFNNLITNALKHNPAGIHLTLDSNLHTAHCLRLTIQDNGIGIPLAQQPHLFERYYRGTHSRYMPGLGLGLYLCRQIVTAHGGEIGVISQPDCGSTFWFTLPLAP